MKKYISIVALMLFSLIGNTKDITTYNKSFYSDPKECSCCKNCKDEKCKELCKNWNSMSKKAKKSEEGKKVKEECMKICEETKCCTASGTDSCQGKEAKNCCKKK